ncbi:MAG: hypothetical protein H6546_04990 [Chitinophagales bacterium]|nr:hypothetical protein [Chitinophagales bacterium]
MDPNDHDVLYYGSSGAYRTTNGGDSWIYRNASLLTAVTAIAVAPSNSNVVYASSLNIIKRSDNMGDTWSDITGDLPTGDIGINYIAVSNVNENELWVALSGYDEVNKVFYSADGGATWKCEWHPAKRTGQCHCMRMTVRTASMWVQTSVSFIQTIISATGYPI